MSSNIDIEKLIPHRYPMILIDRFISVERETILCEVTIREDSFLCEEGRVPSYVGMEYIAQSIAAFDGVVVLKNSKKPQIGFLLGVRNYKSSKSYFNVGEVLTIQATVKIFEGGLASFWGYIFIEGKEVVSTSITTFKPNKDELINLKEQIYGK